MPRPPLNSSLFACCYICCSVALYTTFLGTSRALIRLVDSPEVDTQQRPSTQRTPATHSTTVRRQERRFKSDNTATHGLRLGSGNSFANYEALIGKYSNAEDTPRKNTRERGRGKTPRRAKAAGRNGPQSPDARNVHKPTHVHDNSYSLKLDRSGDETTQDLPEMVPDRHSRPQQSEVEDADLEKESGDLQFILRDFTGGGPANSLTWQSNMQHVAATAWRLTQTPKQDIDVESTRASLDYSARVIDTPRDPYRQHLPLPWIVDSPHATPHELLDLEIAKFARYIDLSPAEAAARQSVIDETLGFVHRMLEMSKLQIEVQGSEQTGLAMPTSDIDFRMSWKVIDEHSEGDPRALSSLLRVLQGVMVHNEAFQSVERRDAKYPIITARHKASGIDIQIVAAPSTTPQQSVTAQYLAELPHLRSLYALLKTAFGVRGLVDVYSGGTGAYGLFMMLVASLKRRGSSPPITAGDQLIRFLEFYTELDTSKHGVSVSPAKLFMKHDPFGSGIKNNTDAARKRGDGIRAGQWAMGQRRLYQPYLLCLQDPANPINDLGRKTNAIKHIQKTVAAMERTLKKDMQDVAAALDSGEAWSQSSILEPIVGRCHEVLFERRKQMEEYGAEVIQGKIAELPHFEVEAPRAAPTFM
ncbi:hypothetical protein LTR09_011099 [Extremus antarcticus]|uniref:Poly(A) RNA polymerase mitochondrial-like central palm domain-containing protein n=1 Tax=Extremus antarcticus TaxID=702011 RepID=A0AAJ0D6U6_9PEZI|nr:hypothetical protein LTR09_011099 [Extremus antarcticus]